MVKHGTPWMLEEPESTDYDELADLADTRTANDADAHRKGES